MMFADENDLIVSDPPPFWLPVLVDVSALVLWMVAGEWLAALFGRSTIDFNRLAIAALFAVGWLFFVAGVTWLEKAALPFALPPWLAGRPLRVGSALFAALVVTFAIGHLIGYFDTAAFVDFGDSGTATYFLLTPAVFFAFSLLYLLALITRYPTRDPAVTFSVVRGLGGINLFLVVCAAWAAAAQRTFWPDAGWLAAAVVIYLLLFGLFLLPRLLYAWRSGHWASLVSFDLLLIALAVLIGRF
jgi:hypothetical protein